MLERANDDIEVSEEGKAQMGVQVMDETAAEAPARRQALAKLRS